MLEDFIVAVRDINQLTFKVHFPNSNYTAHSMYVAHFPPAVIGRDSAGLSPSYWVTVQCMC